MTTVRHPLIARLQARVSAIEERKGGADRRRQLLDGLAGEVVEIGAGSGVSFAHYPASVQRLIAIELEPTLREHRAERPSAPRSR